MYRIYLSVNPAKQDPFPKDDHTAEMLHGFTVAGTGVRFLELMAEESRIPVVAKAQAGVQVALPGRWLIAGHGLYTSASNSLANCSGAEAMGAWSVAKVTTLPHGMACTICRWYSMGMALSSSASK